MRTDKSAYFPLGLAFGLAIGTLLGNPAVGSLLGMLAGLIFRTSGRDGSANCDHDAG